MSDARWIEVFDDVAWAVEHFGRAVEIHAAGGFEGGHLDAYKSRMALLQAMQSGHTSLEGALEPSWTSLVRRSPQAPATMPIWCGASAASGPETDRR